ncbi:unnamed protein product [Discula destructiva]
MAELPPPAQPPRVMLGATLLILLQFASRAVTFIANQLLLRYLTAHLLGVATQLEVYYLSVLFFARESLRVAIQRQESVTAPTTNSQDTTKKDDDKKAKAAVAAEASSTQAAVNLASLSPLLGAVLAALLGALYLKTLTPAILAATPYLHPGVYIYALASLLELLSEPAFVLLQLRLQLTARVRAEAVATMGKCAVTLGVAVYGGGTVGVLPFALGQLAYGVGLLGTYLLYARAQRFSLLPRRLTSTTTTTMTTTTGNPGSGEDDYVLGWFYAPTLRLAATLAAQNLVKYFLTQGDSLLMGALASAEVQGVYALAANYGSLAARLVFQPVEEASRGYFSRLLAASTEMPDKESNEEREKLGQDGTSSNGSTMRINAGTNDKQQQLSSLAGAHTALTRLLHVYTLIALPLLALAPCAAPLLLSLVAGAQWSAAGAGTALAAYVFYIPLLALNGLLEAFVASVATEAQLVRQSVWMAGFFGVFGLVAVALVGEGIFGGWGWAWGARGIVIANGVNMALRIVWAGVFVKGWFGARGVEWRVGAVLPGPGAVAAAAVAGQVVRTVVEGKAVPVDVGSVVWELGKVVGVAVVLLPVL